jgi:GH43 family beta-xylosidase
VLAVCAVLNAQTPQTVDTVQALSPVVINPLMASGADPWIIYRAGFYYFMHTTGNSLRIWRARRLTELAHAESAVVWRAPATGPYSHGIWAPELHYLRGTWYIYFAADAGTNASHRIWVAECGSEDPLAGPWTVKGKVADSTDRWAIDATILEQDSRLYMIWSGWEGEVNVAQHLYIAELADPWTVKSKRVRISSPQYPWEKVGDLTGARDPELNPGLNLMDPVHVDVNEGPEILRHGDRIFLIYSAGGCWTDSYAMGMLIAQAGSELLDPSSWTKSAIPVFWQSPKAGAYGTGHGSFFRSPDGTEDWMVYHANPEPRQGCGGHRAPRAQRFRWNADGTPDFGRPAALGAPMAPPSGEPASARN